MRKYLKHFFILLILALGLWIIANRHSIARFPKIVPSFSAKEFCTCYFVNEQSENYCRHLVRQYLPLKSLQFDSQMKSVHAVGYLAQSSARWVSDRFGCELYESN